MAYAKLDFNLAVYEYDPTQSLIIWIIFIMYYYLKNPDIWYITYGKLHKCYKNGWIAKLLPFCLFHLFSHSLHSMFIYTSINQSMYCNY